MSKRRRGFPSEKHVKRGTRIVHGEKLLEEKLIIAIFSKYCFRDFEMKSTINQRASERIPFADTPFPDMPYLEISVWKTRKKFPAL